jgi:hypothetical protein
LPRPNRSDPRRYPRIWMRRFLDACPMKRGDFSMGERI